MEQDNLVQQEDLMEQEEAEERQLINTMAIVVVVVVAGGILFLALRPWIEQLRSQEEAQDGGEAVAADAGDGNGE